MQKDNLKNTELAEKVEESLTQEEMKNSQAKAGTKVSPKKSLKKNRPEPGETEKKSYTATEASAKVGTKKEHIMYLIKKGRIEAVKGKGIRAPYRIPETELSKLQDLATVKARKKKEKKASLPKLSKKTTEKAQSVPCDGMSSQEFVDIQKILAQTMNRLAATQDQLASMLTHLLKKL